MNEVAAGTNNATFDLNSDGAVNDLDRDEWLAQAGPLNGFAGAFLVGDSDLDGTVAASDLNALGVSWQSDNNNWTQGNYTGGGANSADLNAMALNWQASVPAAAQAVPEPTGIAILVIAFACGVVPRRQRTRPVG